MACGYGEIFGIVRRFLLVTSDLWLVREPKLDFVMTFGAAT